MFFLLCNYIIFVLCGESDRLNNLCQRYLFIFLIFFFFSNEEAKAMGYNGAQQICTIRMMHVNVFVTIYKYIHMRAA